MKKLMNIEPLDLNGITGGERIPIWGGLFMASRQLKSGVWQDKLYNPLGKPMGGWKDR